MNHEVTRQPAEWEPHESCWLAWPSHPDLWGEGLGEVRRAFVELSRAMVRFDSEADDLRPERLDVLVLDARGGDEVRDALNGAVDLRLYTAPFGDIWLRDTAPLFARDGSGGLVAVSFRFNGWGGKYRLAGDEEVSSRLAKLSRVPHRRLDLVAEGGAIEVDGEGTCITTRQCLLNPNRNPGAREEEVTSLLCESLGLERIIWLDEGLANDHTDGHVDNLARFVGSGRVACMVPARSDPNYDVLQEIRSRLGRAEDASGRRLDVFEVPSPGRVAGEDGGILPASYLNFFIANRVVVVPIFGVPTDDEAVEVIGACFPDRRVEAIDCRPLLEGGGAIHCITQQQPSVQKGAASGSVDTKPSVTKGASR